MATIGKGLQAFIAGQSDLPESAAGRFHKPVEDFGYKPTDAQTQRDIARDKKYAPMQTQLFMEEYSKRQAPEPTRMPQVERKGPRMGIGLQRLLQDVKGAVKEPIEAVGATVRKGVNKVIQNQQETEKAMLSAGITPEKITDIGMTVLQTTPAGAAAGALGKTLQKIPEEWMGEKIASELGDVTITRSAKFPDKVQVTYWSGKAGTSPTVADEVFDSVEEAKAAVKK